MKRCFALAPALMLLAACSRAPDEILPGRWVFELVTTSIEVSGFPPGTQQQMQAALNRPQTSRECVTSDNAANPLRVLREQATGGQGATCQTSDDVFSGGVIRFAARCQANGGLNQSQLNLEGRFNAITLEADISSYAEAPNPNGAGSQTLRMRRMFRGRRIGDCARG